MNNDSHYLDTFIGKYEDSIILSTSLDKTQGERKKKKKKLKIQNGNRIPINSPMFY